MNPSLSTKKAGRHSTIIEEARAVVRFVQPLESVSKISPGIIRAGGRRSETSIKVTLQTGCLLITVRGRSSVQELRVYTSEQLILKEHLEKKFP